MTKGLAVKVPDAVRQAAFGPLQEGSRAEEVTRRLSQAIAVGLLPDGTQLPSEAELASSLGVSTMTLRGSLSSLRHQGLLVTHRGRGGGSFVRLRGSAQDDLFRRRLLDLTLDDIRDARDYHATIASGAAALAAERSTKRATARLRAQVEASRQTEDPGAWIRTEARFHIEVAALSRSARLTRAELALQAEIAPLLWLRGAEASTPEATTRAHLELLDALDARDAALARRLADQHVRAGLDHVIRLRMEVPDGDPLVV